MCYKCKSVHVVEFANVLSVMILTAMGAACVRNANNYHATAWPMCEMSQIDCIGCCECTKCKNATCLDNACARNAS